jgi:hypothetical protein
VYRFVVHLRVRDAWSNFVNRTDGRSPGHQLEFDLGLAKPQLMQSAREIHDLGGCQRTLARPGSPNPVK